MVRVKEVAQQSRGVLWISAGLAIAVHGFLALIQLNLLGPYVIDSATSKPLLVKLQAPREPKELVILPDELVVNNPKTQKPIKPDRKTQVRDSEPDKNQTSIPKTTILSADILSKWVEQETNRSTKDNAQELADFKDSFVVIKPTKQADDRLRDLSSLGSGIYKARVNGRHICNLRMRTLSLDSWSGDIVTSGDCTPPEKFEFKLR